MPVIRVEKHEKDYTCIHNQAIRDSRLSFRARGVHHLLLSYCDNWRINTDHLVDQSDEEGKTAIAKALKELEAKGYMTCQMIRDERGQFKGWEKIIRELPIPDSETLSSATGKTVYGKTRRGKTVTGKSGAGKTVSGKTVAGESDRIINTEYKKYQKEEVSILSPTPLTEIEAEKNQERELEPEVSNFEDPEPEQKLIASLPIETKVDLRVQEIFGDDKNSAVAVAKLAPKDPFFTQPHDPQSRSKPRRKGEIFVAQEELDNFYLALLKYAQQSGKTSPVGYAHTIVNGLQNPAGDSELRTPNLFLLEFRAGLPLGSSLQEEWEEAPGVPRQIVVQALEDMFIHERQGITPEQAATKARQAIADRNKMRGLWASIQRRINRVAEEAARNQALGIQSIPTLPYMTEREQIPTETTVEQLQQIQQLQPVVSGANAIAPSAIGSIPSLPASQPSKEGWRGKTQYFTKLLEFSNLKESSSKKLSKLVISFKLDDRLPVI